MDKKRLQVAVGVIKNAAGQILLALRDGMAHQGGVWEFPGGKLEAGESAYQALVRELKEELAIAVTVATPLLTVNHQYPERAVRLWVFEVSEFSGEPYGNEGQPLQWVDAANLRKFAFPAANGPIITAAQLPDRYAILDTDETHLLLPQLQNILAHGIKLVQVRLKNLPSHILATFLEHAYPLCQAQNVRLLANSALELAHHPSFSGIHLTGRDLLTASQRPDFQWVGASCHTLLDLQYAEKIGVDFAVLAPVLPTLTHPNADTLGWDKFTDWVAKVNVPVYALGGMTRASLATARLAGAQGIASIRAFL